MLSIAPRESRDTRLYGTMPVAWGSAPAQACSGRQEAVQDADAEVEAADGDAFVDPVEHPEIVQGRVEKERGEPVAVDTDPGKGLGVGAAGHDVRDGPSLGVLGSDGSGECREGRP